MCQGLGGSGGGRDQYFCVLVRVAWCIQTAIKIALRVRTTRIVFMHNSPPSSGTGGVLLARRSN